MLSPADRIVEAALKYTLRPKGNDREKVIAAALEFVIEEYGYDDEYGLPGTMRHDVVDIEDIRNLIDELKSTVTPDELAQDLTNPPVEVLEFNGICRDNCQGTKISSLPGLPE